MKWAARGGARTTTTISPARFFLGHHPSSCLSRVGDADLQRASQQITGESEREQLERRMKRRVPSAQVLVGVFMGSLLDRSWHAVCLLYNFFISLFIVFVLRNGNCLLSAAACFTCFRQYCPRLISHRQFFLLYFTSSQKMLFELAAWIFGHIIDNSHRIRLIAINSCCSTWRD